MPLILVLAIFLVQGFILVKLARMFAWPCEKNENSHENELISNALLKFATGGQIT